VSFAEIKFREMPQMRAAGVFHFAGNTDQGVEPGIPSRHGGDGGREDKKRVLLRYIIH